jgi:hypothetical protein
MNGLPQPPGGFDPNGPQFQEDPRRLAMAQPPQPQMQPPAAPQPTMGQAQDMAGGNSYLQMLDQALQHTQQMIQPAMRQPLPETAKPGIWANIMTWGGAGAQHHLKEAAYNQGVEEYNKQLKLWAAEQAKDMVKDYTTSQALSGRANLQQMGFALKLQNAELQAQRFAAEEADRRFRQWKDTTFGPPSSADTEAAANRGEIYAPVQNPFGGGGSRYRLQPKQGGGWSMPGPPPAPGSPAAVAMGGESGGAAPGGLTPSPENAAAIGRQHKVEDRQAVPTASTRTRAEAAPKVIALIGEARKALEDAETSGMGVGPGASRWRAGKTALGFSDPKFITYKDTVGMLHSLLMNMHTGSRSSELLLKKFEGMGEPQKQSASNMRAMFNMAERYARIVDQHKGAETPDELTAAGIPTSIAPTAGAGTPSTQPTPGNLGKPRVSLEEFLSE